MKPSARFWAWYWPYNMAIVFAMLGILRYRSRPEWVVLLSIPLVIGIFHISIALSKLDFRSSNWRDRYSHLYHRPRQTDAGRWVEAPVAELDKSTFGKLLASRVKREPRLRVVPSNPPPASLDALYDAELDG